MASAKVVKTPEHWIGGRSRRTLPMTHSTATPSSLVFDMDVEEEVTPVPRKSSHQCDLPAFSQRLNYFSTPQGEFAQQLLRDVRSYKAVVQREESRLDVVVLATKLSSIGYRVHVRTALGGGDACFKNLRHEFLVVRGEGDFEQYEYLVEPQLRDHFEIPHPSSTYLEIFHLIPEEFVGTVSSLSQVVQSLCAEMAASFAAQGLTLPPWRRADSVLSKWMPARSKDVSPGDSRVGSSAECSTQFVSSEQCIAGKLPSQLRVQQADQTTSSSRLTVKPPSVPGLLPVYSVQFGFAPRVAG